MTSACRGFPGQRRAFPRGLQPLLTVVPLDSVQAIFKMISPEDVKHLPGDENTPEKRAEKIWGFFGKKDDGECFLPPYLSYPSHGLLPGEIQPSQSRCPGRTGHTMPGRAPRGWLRASGGTDSPVHWSSPAAPLGLPLPVGMAPPPHGLPCSLTARESVGRKKAGNGEVLLKKNIFGSNLVAHVEVIVQRKGNPSM